MESIDQQGDQEYSKVLEELYSVNRRNDIVVRPGLVNITRLNDALGDPARELKAIHVVRLGNAFAGFLFGNALQNFFFF